MDLDHETNEKQKPWETAMRVVVDEMTTTWQVFDSDACPLGEGRNGT